VRTPLTERVFENEAFLQRVLASTPNGQLATPVAVFAMLLLAAYLALYPAVTALILGHLLARFGTRALLLAPAAWVATEYLRGYLFGGFPWVPIGNSQVTVLPVAQLASVCGVYGVSALVVLVNAAIAYALLTKGRQRVTALVTVSVVLVALAGWGSWRIADGSLTRQGTPIRVGLVQGNIESWIPSLFYPVLIVTTLAITIVCASLSYYLVERPLMRWKR